MLVPNVSGVTSFATGWSHACALTPNSGVLCWGSNTTGQLGHVVDPSSSSTVDTVGY
jgi:alpha-tubulin suppressor-like RCC1 family protein